MPLKDCFFIELPQIHDPRGKLSFVESFNQVPFEIKRLYFLYDVPSGAERGAHAHKTLMQFILPLSGSFDVILDDGNEKKRFHLNRPYQGLLVGPYVWRSLDNFSSGAICAVVASDKYIEEDYIRDYEEYLKATKDQI